MDGQQQCARAKSNRAPAHRSESSGRPRHRAKRACPERYDQRRLHQRKFTLQPPAAVVDLACAGTLMDASFSARDEFEMLDRIGEVALTLSEARLA